MTIRNSFPDVRPALNLDFANTKRLDPRITFTRSSTGTYVDEFGVIKTAANNEARFDHDGSGNSLGLLIEESRTNLLTYSEEFDNVAWAKSNASITPNATTAPDGMSTADKLIANTANSSHFIFDAVAVSAGTTTCSVYVKAAEVNGFYLSAYDGSAYRDFAFDLSSGTKTIVEPGLSSSIERHANGWYRVSCTYVSTGANNTIHFFLYPNQQSPFLGDGTSGLYIWGAQLEAGSFPTSYIPTSGSTATRSADVASMTGTNFSSWYNQSEGTMQMIFNASPLNTNTQFLGVGTTSSTVAGYVYRASTLYAVQANGANNWSNTSSWLTTGITVGNNRFVFGYSPGSNATVRNGLIQETNTETVIVQQTSTTLYIAKELTGHISRLTYYDRRLTDAQLQALTL